MFRFSSQDFNSVSVTENNIMEFWCGISATLYFDYVKTKIAHAEILSTTARCYGNESISQKNE